MRSRTAIKQRGKHRTSDTLYVDTGMLEESLILDRHDGFVDVGVLDVGVRNIDTVNVLTTCQLGDDGTVTVVDERCLYGIGHRNIRDRERCGGRDIADQHTPGKSSD